MMSGQGSGPGGVTMQYVGYALRSLPAGFYFAELVTTAVPGPAGGALLRADAEVIWFPARSAAEHLDPASFGKVTVSAAVLNPKRHIVHRALTSPAVIARLARILNALPAAPAVSFGCPAIGASYRFVFAATADRARDMIVTTYGCAADRVTARGKAQPALWDRSDRLMAAADHLLRISPHL